MPLAPTIATQLTDHSARAFGLFVDNVDVSAAPALGRTSMERITVTERGPGGVSSMSFTIEDPTMAVTVTPGMEVRFQDSSDGSNTYPLFLGWVQSYSIQPAFGEQGRVIAVEAIGVEALLDWLVVPQDVTVGAGLEIYTAIQSLVSYFPGLGGIKALADPAAAPRVSSPDYGLGKPTPTAWATLGLTIPAGTSLREAIRMVAANLQPSGPTVGSYGYGFTTIDFTLGLRHWQAVIPNSGGVDYALMTVVNTIGASILSEALSYDVDASGVVRGVYFKGSSPANSVNVYDGTGLPGPISYIEDTTVDSPAKATVAANAYLAQFALGIRGSFALTDRTDIMGGSNYHAGSRLGITDVHVGLGGISVDPPVFIAAITKTFTGRDPLGADIPKQSWLIEWGGPAPSAMSAIRRLTRNQRN